MKSKGHERPLQYPTFITTLYNKELTVHIWGLLVALETTRAASKVRGLTLLLWVGTSWRCGDRLFFKVPLLAGHALLTTLNSLIENVLQTVYHFEISCHGALLSLLEKLRNKMGRDLNWILCSTWKKWIGGTPLEHQPYSPDLALRDFWAFPTTYIGVP
jgi:hypothetical protein